MRQTRNSKRQNAASKMDLFGIRLKTIQNNYVQSPNTKDKKIKFLNSVGINMYAFAKAKEVNEKIRSYLLMHITNSHLCHSKTIPMLYRMVFGHLSEYVKYGTVIAYLPATEQHCVKYDNENITIMMDLTCEKNWERIPWNNNRIDSISGNEISDSTYIDFGPDCPRCANFLGIGTNAWSYCKICGLNEPGAGWSTRFSNMREHVKYDESE